MFLKSAGIFFVNENFDFVLNKNNFVQAEESGKSFLTQLFTTLHCLERILGLLAIYEVKWGYFKIRYSTLKALPSCQASLTNKDLLKEALQDFQYQFVAN